MADLILHHYPSSPFAEKVRRMLAYKKLDWLSVHIPRTLPKPDLMPLTGGYRRTPVLQIGADVYCDTALIADVLERLHPEPSLYPAPAAGMARILGQWADATLFWTVVPYVFQPAGAKSILAGMSPEEAKAFRADRAAMRGGFNVLPLPDASVALAEYLRRLDDMLAGGNPWLCGAQASIADFSVYHALWFLANAKDVAGILDDTPRLLEWMERIAEMQHGAPRQIVAADALKVAQASTPAAFDDAGFVDAHGVVLGDTVSITPSDYALDPVVGELVMATENEYAVRRSDARAGTVVVHFPRLGFTLARVEDK
jgi:glutathione S-transferase